MFSSKKCTKEISNVYKDSNRLKLMAAIQEKMHWDSVEKKISDVFKNETPEGYMTLLVDQQPFLKNNLHALTDYIDPEEREIIELGFKHHMDFEIEKAHSGIRPANPALGLEEIEFHLYFLSYGKVKKALFAAKTDDHDVLLAAYKHYCDMCLTLDNLKNFLASKNYHYCGSDFKDPDFSLKVNTNKALYLSTASYAKPMSVDDIVPYSLPNIDINFIYVTTELRTPDGNSRHMHVFANFNPNEDCLTEDYGIDDLLSEEKQTSRKYSLDFEKERLFFHKDGIIHCCKLDSETLNTIQFLLPKE